MENLKECFYLDPSVIFLNHGSFGATPRIVFEAYQRWQLELERQPVEFLGRRHDELMKKSRSILAEFAGTSENNVVYVTNATVGLNIVAHSLDLGPGDEVLASDHEYGAIDRTWRFLAKERGFVYQNCPVSLPLGTEDEFVENIWKYINPRTRVLFLSQITSPTAIIFPIEKICARARKEGIYSVIDGAHAPGQIPLALDSLGADFWVGNLHKWLMSPKGAGFLYARPEVQDQLKPLVVSWGYEAEAPGPSRFIDHQQWSGTRDIAAFLAVEDAINFQKEHNWELVREECFHIAEYAQEKICDLTGLKALHKERERTFRQMVAIPLPENIDGAALKVQLYDEFRIEIPITTWKGNNLIRVSVQGYNSRNDIDELVKALKALLTRKHMYRTAHA